ncbi:MAG: 16S rRNA processing protein RimM [Lachnospiraceae bacterium]|nr:16S rRNA processing protein RimM [Lachnospiraceae bacterium]
MEQYLRVGTIINTHGIRGEVKVYPATDDIKRFSVLEKVFLDEVHSRKCLHIENVKYFKQTAILKFKGFDRIEDIEGFKGLDIFVSREDAVPLEEGEYYIADLIDMKVQTAGGGELGILKDVMKTGANDVYIVDSPKYGEVLIPAIPQCIQSVDIETGIMTVELLPGLLDLSRSGKKRSPD